MKHSKPKDFVPEIHFPDGHPRAGKPRCQSWNPNQGRQCEALPMRGGIRCRSHGGKTPKGMASPNLKTGIYSKYLPSRLAGQYETLLELGNDLFKLDNETAALTTLIQESLGKIESGESGAAWRKLQSLYDEMIELSAISDKTPEETRRLNLAFVEMGQILKRGNMTYAARDEAVKFIENKRRVVSDERKDQAAKHQAMTFDRVMLIMVAMASSFKQSLEKHLSDIENGKKKQRAILGDTQRLLDRVISN